MFQIRNQAEVAIQDKEDILLSNILLHTHHNNLRLHNTVLHHLTTQVLRITASLPKQCLNKFVIELLLRCEWCCINSYSLYGCYLWIYSNCIYDIVQFLYEQRKRHNSSYEFFIMYLRQLYDHKFEQNTNISNMLIFSVFTLLLFTPNFNSIIQIRTWMHPHQCIINNRGNIKWAPLLLLSCQYRKELLMPEHASMAGTHQQYQ